MLNLLCVTVYVMNHKKQFAMLHHRKLNKWVPPGGKVDADEIPDVAAVRECKEETGLDVELIGELSKCEGGLMMPYGIQYNIVKPGELGHYDLIYLARPISSNDFTISEREAHKIGWFSLKEIESLDTFPSVLTWCERFKDML